MEYSPVRRKLLKQSATGTFAVLLHELGLAAPETVPTSVLPVTSVVRRASRTVKPEYFGATMHWPVRAPYVQNVPSVPIAAWRAIVAELHWFSLEPRPGEWKFEKLDLAMRLMESSNIDVLMALGETPTWASSNPTFKGPYIYGQLSPPRNLADWENYVRTVALRYKGRIRDYELWNEPTVREVDGDKAHFTAAQLVALGQSARRIIKEIDPQARLTSPAMVGGERGVARMDAYFAAGGDKCTDIVNFHYYGLPEQIPQYHDALLKVMARYRLAHLPVWNTEFGYLIEDPTTPNTHPLSGGSFSRVLPDHEAAIWLARSLIIGASVGIERFYWFMWDGKNMGLLTVKERNINAAGIAYGTIASWLTGRQVGNLERIGNIVSCSLAENGRIIGRLVWTFNYKSMRWTIPKPWKSETMISLTEREGNIPSSGEIELSASPVLILSVA
jgi:hypothetical protein